MDRQQTHNLQTGYDRVAQEYTRRIFDELAHKPLDRMLLDRFAAAVQAIGPACDIGCGPGHVARYVHDQGVDVCGIDLSRQMITLAQQHNPGIRFYQGNMLALAQADATCGGITAFYSIIHVPRGEVVCALQEFYRVLLPHGLVLLAFHIGADSVHLNEWWGQSVALDFHFFQPEAMTDYLAAAGFLVDEVIERPPYPDVEHQSQRAYIFAHKS